MLVKEAVLSTTGMQESFEECNVKACVWRQLSRRRIWVKGDRKEILQK